MRTFKYMTLLVLTVLATLPLRADYVVNGITYRSLSDTTLAVADADKALTDVVIPEVVDVMPNGMTVVKILDNAFCESNITSVVLPQTLTSIGDNAFQGCKNLTEVRIPDQVQSIGAQAFASSGLKSVVIGKSVNSMDRCFYNTPLDHLMVVEGNETYDSREDCNALILTAENKLVQATNNTVIPASVTRIGYQAYGGSSLNVPHLELGPNITHVESEAFYNNKSLQTITIGENVRMIERKAFFNCVNLRTVHLNAIYCQIIPEYINARESALPPDFSSASYIGLSPFARAGDYYVYETVVIHLDSISFGPKVEHIPDHLLELQKNITQVTLPQTLTSIGNYAFQGCNNLTEVRIPEQVQSIGRYAFSSTGLKSIVIGKSVNSIINSFYGTPLDHLMVVEGNVTYDSREDCNALILTDENKLVQATNNTVIPASVTRIGNRAYGGLSLNVPHLELGPNITHVESEAFHNNKSLQTITIGENVRSIGRDAFFNCVNLRTVHFNAINCNLTHSTIYKFDYISDPQFPRPASVGYSPFTRMGDIYGEIDVIYLDSITFGPKVECIDEHLLEFQKNITHVTLPDGLRIIDDEAFNESGLEQITLPAKLKRIGWLAFNNCRQLKSVNCLSPNPDIALKPNGRPSYPFGGIPADATLTVPAGTKELFAAHESWQAFGEIVEAARPKADLNGDERVDIADVNIAISLMLGMPQQTTLNPADSNNDGTIDINDINDIINQMLH